MWCLDAGQVETFNRQSGREEWAEDQRQSS